MKQIDPAWEKNSNQLSRRFGKLYPCAQCRRNGMCTGYTCCVKFMSFFRAAWAEIIELLKGEST